MYPSWGKTLIKRSVKVFGVANVSPTLMTFGVSTVGAYVAEVLIPDKIRCPKTWQEYAQMEAQADLAMAAADTGLLLLLQMGNMSNINFKTSGVSIVGGGFAGDLAYDKFVKPMLVDCKKGRARSYNRRSRDPESIFNAGKTMGQINGWMNQFFDNNLQSEMRSAETAIILDDAGFST
jgi:hypothetical protein